MSLRGMDKKKEPEVPNKMLELSRERIIRKKQFNDSEIETIIMVIDNYLIGYRKAYSNSINNELSKVKRDYEKVIELKGKTMKLI